MWWGGLIPPALLMVNYVFGTLFYELYHSWNVASASRAILRCLLMSPSVLTKLLLDCTVHTASAPERMMLCSRKYVGSFRWHKIVEMSFLNRYRSFWVFWYIVHHKNTKDKICSKNLQSTSKVPRKLIFSIQRCFNPTRWFTPKK